MELLSVVIQGWEVIEYEEELRVKNVRNEKRQHYILGRNHDWKKLSLQFS